MSQFVINGGNKIEGTIEASGNKNAALTVLPACLLTDEPVVLHHIPNILDVRNTVKLMRDMGVEVTALDKNSWRIQAKDIQDSVLNPELASKTRASILFSGAMLGRVGAVTLPIPGGDVIGGRPLDTHMQGLEALGVDVEYQRGKFIMKTDGLKGAGRLLQAQASVTATENTVMAAVLADGTTVLENAASEPHIQDLCNLLVAMGARIDGIGSNRLIIEGVKKLHGAEYTIGSDFVTIGSYIAAAAITEGTVRINNACPDDMTMTRMVYDSLGVHWEVEGKDIIVPADQSLVVKEALGGRIPEIRPHPWPGFPPDLMSIAVILSTQTAGTVLLHDWMYESRFFFVDKLVAMGAKIVICDPHRVMIQGKSNLHGAYVASPDIRAGMAMVLAALCAEGQTVISNIHQIDRGYEDVEHKLRSLGADIMRVSDET